MRRKQPFRFRLPLDNKVWPWIDRRLIIAERVVWTALRIRRHEFHL